MVQAVRPGRCGTQTLQGAGRYFNKSEGGLELIKVNEDDKTQRIPNVTFEIHRMDGGLVETVTTNKNGRVFVNLDAGNYYAVEIETAEGFKLDNTPHYFEVVDGKTTTLTVTNKPFSGIIIHKVDSVTGEGIYEVKFLLYDANKNPIGEYVTDNEGYSTASCRYTAQRQTKLVPGYLVRYADDFVIVTDTRAHAEDWKSRLQKFLKEKLKLTLSQEKTLITDIRKKYIKFLGYEFKMVRGKSRRGYIPRTIPDRERLKRKVDKIAQDIKRVPRNYSKEQMIGAINRINSQVRGLIQYYQCCTWVNISMKKYSRRLQMVAKTRLKQYGGKWIPANQTQNLPRVHQKYKQKIPSIKYRDIYVGFTALSFCKWERTPPKKEDETPYTETGRQLYFERTKKKRIQARLDEMYSDKSARAISYGHWGKLNNFEFIMNRAYALNRDKLKCRVCGGWLISSTPWAHRVNPNLPLNKVNRVNNLVSLHKKCFLAVNGPNQDISEFDDKAQKKILGLREKLVTSHTRNN